MSQLAEAIKVATKYHEGQMRKDGTLYIEHPLSVMRLLEGRNFPEEALIAAVLHDVCEDTSMSNLDINGLFGSRVGFIVNALSKNKKPKNNAELKAEYKEKQKLKKITNLETYSNFEEFKNYRFHIYLNRLYTGIIAEPWIFFIKIADQIDNLKDMTPFPRDKKLRKIEEVETYFLPIYQKSKNILSIDINSENEYNYFLNLLLEAIKKAKKDL